MPVDPQPRARLRNLLLFIILATIPCYCAGMAAGSACARFQRHPNSHLNPHPLLDAGGVPN